MTLKCLMSRWPQCNHNMGPSLSLFLASVFFPLSLSKNNEFHFTLYCLCLSYVLSAFLIYARLGCLLCLVVKVVVLVRIFFFFNLLFAFFIYRYVYLWVFSVRRLFMMLSDDLVNENRKLCTNTIKLEIEMVQKKRNNFVRLSHV